MDPKLIRHFHEQYEPVPEHFAIRAGLISPPEGG